MRLQSIKEEANRRLLMGWQNDWDDDWPRDHGWDDTSWPVDSWGDSHGK